MTGDVTERRRCIFEYIYFARPDSVLDGVSVHRARVKAGEILARLHPVEADIVIGAPDSGLDAALGFSRASGIPYGIGLIKNKYIGRTFISPGQSLRLDQVRIKLSAVEASVRDRRVVLIYEDIGAAFPLPMLLRNRYRLEGKSYSKFPHRQRNCRVDRSRFAGISAGGGAGEA